jgi:hypothetical protein
MPEAAGDTMAAGLDCTAARTPEHARRGTSGALGADGPDSEPTAQTTMASAGSDETLPPSDGALPDELLCAICIDLLIDPCTSFPCGHSFCGACVGTWLDRGRAACPTCGLPMSCVALSFTLKAIVERHASADGVAACRARRGVTELTSFARRARPAEYPLVLRGLHGPAVEPAAQPADPPALPEAVLRLLRPRNLLCLWLAAFLFFFAFFAHHNLQLLLSDPTFSAAPHAPDAPAASAHDWPALPPEPPSPVAFPLAAQPEPEDMYILSPDPPATALLVSGALQLVLAVALFTASCGLALGWHAALRRPRRPPPLLAGGAVVGVCVGVAAVAVSLAASSQHEPSQHEGAPLLRLLRAHHAAADPSLRLFWATYVSTVGALLDSQVGSLPALALRVFVGSFVLFVALLVYAQVAAQRAAQRPVRWEQPALDGTERGEGQPVA